MARGQVAALHHRPPLPTHVLTHCGTHAADVCSVLHARQTCCSTQPLNVSIGLGCCYPLHQPPLPLTLICQPAALLGPWWAWSPYPDIPSSGSVLVCGSLQLSLRPCPGLSLLLRLQQLHYSRSLWRGSGRKRIES